MVDSKFNLVIDAENIDYVGGRATGAIYFEIGDQSYPVEGWDDFPFSLVSMWMKELHGALNGKAEAFCLHFMDGPFALRVDPVSGSDCVLSVRNDSVEGGYQEMGTASLEAIVRAVRHGAALLLLSAGEQREGVPEKEDLRRLMALARPGRRG